MATWVIASDFAGRIADLIEALDDIEPVELAERASVGAEQIRRWLRDEVKPRQKTLERWAKREGWPVKIFAEGGMMPSAIVNRPVNKSTETKKDYLLRVISNSTEAISRASDLLASNSTEAAQDVLRRAIRFDEWQDEQENDS